MKEIESNQSALHSVVAYSVSTNINTITQST